MSTHEKAGAASAAPITPATTWREVIDRLEDLTDPQPAPGFGSSPSEAVRFCLWTLTAIAGTQMPDDHRFSLDQPIGDDVDWIWAIADTLADMRYDAEFIGDAYARAARLAAKAIDELEELEGDGDG